MIPTNLNTEVINLISPIAALLSSLAALAMVFFRRLDFKNEHKDQLQHQLKSSMQYHEKFYLPADNTSYSKYVHDNAAQALFMNQKVDARLVNILIQLHDLNKLNFHQMQSWFNTASHYGYVIYDPTQNINKCFAFRFSQQNILSYHASPEKIKKTKKMAMVLFNIQFWVTLLFSLFFIYLIANSTDIISFLYPFFFGILSIFTAFYSLRLNMAMQHTELFLEHFYRALSAIEQPNLTQ